MSTYHVLVADDDASIRNLILRLCLEMNWTADLAVDGEEALKYLAEKPHQIFVLDVKMPGPSGLDLARRILQTEEAPAILILTGYAELENAIQAIKEGVYDYIQKDVVQIEDLKRILARAADYREKRLRSLRAQREREKTIHNMEAANRQFQSILELSSDLIFILDARTRQIIDCNAAARRRLGYERQELLDLKFSAIDQDLAQAKWEESLRTSLSDKPPLVEIVFQGKGGISFPVEVSFDYVCLDTGEFIAVVARDITERKKVEESLREREEVLSKITTSAQDAIVMMDHEGNITFWNPAAERIFGYSSQESIGKELHTLLAPQSYYQDYHRGLLSFQKTGEGAAIGKTLELTAIRKDGKIIPVEISLSAVPIKNQWNAIGILRDISQRKQNEEKIEQAKQLAETQAAMLRTIIESMDEGVVITDELHRITETNEGFVRLAQTPKEFLLGADLNCTIHEISGCEIASILNSFQSSKEWYKTNLQGEISGNKVLLSLQPIVHNSVFQGSILTIVDISDLILAQEKAEEDNRNKNELFLTMQKEMQAPLDGLLEMTDQALSVSTSDELRMLLDTIKQCGTTLKNILIEIRNMAN